MLLSSNIFGIKKINMNYTWYNIFLFPVQRMFEGFIIDYANITEEHQYFHYWQRNWNKHFRLCQGKQKLNSLKTILKTCHNNIIWTHICKEILIEVKYSESHIVTQYESLLSFTIMLLV